MLPVRVSSNAGAGQVLKGAQRVSAGTHRILCTGQCQTDRHAGGGVLVGHRVDAGAAGKHVVAAIAFQRVVLARTRQVLDAEKRVALGVTPAGDTRRQADIDPCERGRIRRRVGARTAVEQVRAAQARKDIIAPKAKYLIITGCPVTRVVSVGAVDDCHFGLLQ